MSKKCQLTGAKPMTGNNVSHSHRKTKRRFQPNLLRARLRSETLGRQFNMRISASTLRNIDKHGGLDAFLLKAGNNKLSENARKLKRDIARAGTRAS